jgi:hypothetical protein
MTNGSTVEPWKQPSWQSSTGGGSPAVLAALKASYCPCDASAILAALRLLSETYRTQLIELHGGFDLSRSLASDLEAIDIIRSQAC